MSILLRYAVLFCLIPSLAIGAELGNQALMMRGVGGGLTASPPPPPPPPTGIAAAFPGAEGFGAVSIGGRGGTAIKVTTTSDTGAGSFRECVTRTFPRTCIFNVSGDIVLSTDIILDVSNSYLTIAGQTSPGGVQVRGGALLMYGGIHDVTIRYMRFRRGWQSGTGGDQRLGLVFEGKLSNQVTLVTTGPAIVDHTSFAWQQDDNCTWSQARNVTFQWNIFAEPTNPTGGMNFTGGKNCLVGTDPGDGDAMQNISIHHNLFMHGYERNPAVLGKGPTEVVNNVMYNYMAFSSDVQNRGPVGGDGAGTQINYIGNNWKAGPDTFSARGEVLIYKADTTACPSGTCSWIEELNNMIYVLDNLSPHRTTGQPEWNVVRYCDAASGSYCADAANTAFQRGTPWPGSVDYPITVTSASSNVANVLAGAGATLPSRDAMDTRLVTEYNNTTAANTANINTWPTLTGGSAPTDTDGDGMPDTWEDANGLDKTDASDGPRISANGYSNLENYLNNVTGVGPGGGGGAGGLVGHWNFDEGSGTTALDSSGNGLNGTFVGSPTRIAGRIGSGALSFVQGQYVNVPDNALLQMAGDFSVAAWVKTTQAESSTDTPTLISKDVHTGPASTTNGYQMILHFALPSATPNWSLQVLQTGTLGTAGFGTINLADGNWHHVVGVRRGSTIETYEDGALAHITTGAVTGPITAPANPLIIGSTSASDQFYIGALDDVQIYNCALSASKVTAIFGGGGDGSC